MKRLFFIFVGFTLICLPSISNSSNSPSSTEYKEPKNQQVVNIKIKSSEEESHSFSAPNKKYLLSVFIDGEFRKNIYIEITKENGLIFIFEEDPSKLGFFDALPTIGTGDLCSGDETVLFDDCDNSHKHYEYSIGYYKDYYDENLAINIAKLFVTKSFSESISKISFR
ncbi:MAG: hypothetical protein AB7S50_15235 [Bacteroidales bacterium]